MFILLFVHRRDQLLQKVSGLRISQQPGKCFHVRRFLLSGFRCRRNSIGVFSFPCIERVLKQLGIDPAIIIQNMRIYIGHHRGLRMAGISLNGLYITPVELQLIGDTGMAKAMKDHFRETILLNKSVKRGFNG